MPAKRVAETLSLFDLMQRYPTRQSVIDYFEQIRWGGKPHCTKCGCDTKISPNRKRAGTYWCGECREYFTAWTGTPLEDAKVDQRKWIFAAYLLMTARKGISAMQLSKELSVQYKTAWYMLHRLRLGCGGRMEALKGTVEVDETYLGGKRRNMSNAKRKALKAAKVGRGAVGKDAVVGVRQRGGNTVAKPVEETNAATLVPFVEENVEPGSTVYTDDAAVYGPLPNIINQFEHDTVAHSASEYVRGDVHTNGMESVWAVLKRGYHGIYHGWSKKHMLAYVNEFTFRLNDGNCQIDTKDRLDSLFRGLVGQTITYKGLTA